MAVFEVTNSLGFTHQYPTDSSTWRAEYKQLYNADIVSERVLGVDEVPPGQASSVGPDPSLPKATFPESPVTPPPTPLTAEPPRSVDQIIQDAAERAIEQFKARAGEFDTRNPFLKCWANQRHGINLYPSIAISGRHDAQSCSRCCEFSCHG